ncbi:AAA ATPase central domain protein [Emticicia oligotrophica DSM 17448]|uniref:Replication-associated recombination protein A n=1 Tax=Emticicia oligotrophica (strain DSM 17448 / CIP 109782 / MTCC 6937 / GPTSA100-15) TaxID=929562 RepID=A0ABM5MYP2_EMTOG|nr:replication-associated recombination protein A [Emticicia oligotrophica]AFK02247.1 AAA ATPase central domain protein [Emticicia oligotrophica DSM 17448]
MSAPLAERLRPKKLDEYIGQEHILGKNKPLRTAIEANLVPSMILWGPPGTGKTTLALLIAEATKRQFHQLNAISSGVKELREVIGKATGLFPPIVFIDEIHRYNKSQQDSLLAAVEKGSITLIGATTENPSFELNSAVLSRCQVYILEAFGQKELKALTDRAITEDSILKERNIKVESYDALMRLSGGDGRKLLNLLEMITFSYPPDAEIVITDDLVEEVAQRNIARYDKSGEQHYDIISAFIKSLRGSDPNAALYWMARMIVAGEDPEFIARRMLILASEDIGNANPTAVIMANNCMQAVRVIGYPECRIILSQTAIYLATSPKSNASYMAIDAAIALAEKTAHLPVPLALRNAPTKLMKEIGYGKGYMYSHNYAGNFAKQNFLPNELKGTKIYEPSNNARENEIRKQLQAWWAEWYGY